MRRAVDGRFKVVFLETTLPLLKVVTVTLGATVVFLTALVAFAVCEVLRVRLLRGVVGFAADDLTGIETKFVCLPSYYKHKKTPVGVLCDTFLTVIILIIIPKISDVWTFKGIILLRGDPLKTVLSDGV